MRTALVIAVTALGLVGAKKPAETPASREAPYSAIYCLAGPHNDFRYFAGKEQPDGRLLFGVSHWYPNGHNVSIYGVARREGDHWVHEEDMDSADPADHCKVRIWLHKDGTPRMAADKVARCESNGGYGTNLGEITFPRHAYYHGVTHELDDAEAFQGADVCDDFGG